MLHLCYNNKILEKSVLYYVYARKSSYLRYILYFPLKRDMLKSLVQLTRDEISIGKGRLLLNINFYHTVNFPKNF